MLDLDAEDKLKGSIEGKFRRSQLVKDTQGGDLVVLLPSLFGEEQRYDTHWSWLVTPVQQCFPIWVL